MSREQERIRRKLENNPVMECNKIRVGIALTCSMILQIQKIREI